MSRIFIYTGEIKTGKTTRLLKWVSEHNGADGLLSPVIDGQRHLKVVNSGEIKLLEYSGNNKSLELTQIGRYNFLKDVFKWGRETLYISYMQKPKWLIIDEIGPLELRGEGLEPEVSKILNDGENLHTGIIIVVRQPLLETVIEHYGLQSKGYKLFNIENAY